MLRSMAVVFMLLPVLANADQPTADACAANLPTADAKTIYAAVTAEFVAGNAQPDVGGKIAALAQAGKIDRGSMRENSRAAAACLKLWR